VELKLSELNVDANLPESHRQVTQEHINLYAEASQDFNPIHLDPAFARQAGLDGTIAHGMLILAYVSEFMTVNFGQAWLTGGNLNARFKAPARPDDTITISGKVSAIERENGAILINCDVLCQNQRDEPVIVCEAKVRMKTDEDSS
jgi:3-hydroxybutyryl-CoA dehydratase